MGENHHLGHLVLDCFRKRPNVICQVDAATGASETNASVLSRSIRVAYAFRALGFHPGDVVALSGWNHLDLHIPYYAALFNGLPLVGVDPFFKFDEIKALLKLSSPKIAFCEPETYEDFVRAAQELGLATRVVSFGDDERGLKAFMEKHATGESEDDFEPAALDQENSLLWLISTSGTSGPVKIAACTYATFYDQTKAYIKQIQAGAITSENKPALNISPVHWVSGFFNPVGMPLLGQTVVQTSAPPTVEHLIDIINKYKPFQALLRPTDVSYLMNSDKECDLTCFKSLIIGGAKVPVKVLTELRSRMAAGSRVVEMHGQTETLGPVLAPRPDCPLGSCGSPSPRFHIRLVDSDSGAVITEPHVMGEMQVKGPIFSGYYKNPEATKAAFTEDGWFRTGDMFYRDENNSFFFVERLKTLIKYQGYHVIPAELEKVIQEHPGVQEVVVTGVPHPLDGEWPVACIVPLEGATLAAEDITNLLASHFSEKKQLRGGVVFMKEFPRTSTGKTSIKEVKRLAIEALS